MVERLSAIFYLKIMAYCFFTEPEKLSITQTQSKAFGPIDENQFRLCSLYSATTIPKALALTTGNILVQEVSDDSTLVNIVIKPSEQPDLDLPKISYIIYKGILKSSIIENSGIIAPSENNDLTKKIWDSHALQVAAFANNPDVVVPADPLAKDVLGFGYSETGSGDELTVDTDHLDKAFYSNSKTLFPVSGSDYIGDFHTAGFGILIAFEKIGFAPTFKLARELDSVLSFDPLAAGASNATEFERKHKKEDTLSFIDPCAFFGGFYGIGIQIYTNNAFVNWSGQDLYNNIIIKHVNKNKLYLDIRNEFDDSFNYYNNFNNDIKLGLDLSDTAVSIDYYRSSWPVLILDNSEIAAANTNKIIKLSLPVKPDQLPLPYLKNAYRADIGLSKLPKGREKFLPVSMADINGDFVELSENLILFNQNNFIISNYHQLKYFLKSPEIIDDTALLFKQAYLDNLFPVFDMNIPFDENSGKSYFKLFYDNTYTDKTLINTADYSTSVGIARDKSLLTLISFPHNYNDNAQQNNDDKIPVGGMEGPSGSLFLNELMHKAQPISLVKNKFVIAGTDQEYLKFETNLDPDSPVTDQINNNYTFEDVSVITLTNQQYLDIKEIKEQEFINEYKVYLGIEEIVTGSDDFGVEYCRFKYVLNGLKEEEGEIAPHQVDTTIEATTDIKIRGKSYERNYEENVGNLNALPAGGGNYEDYFINLSPNIKAIVDDFTQAIKNIDINLPSAFERYKSLIKSSARSLWQQAVNTAQSSSGSPDDRPLYWARIKMEVVIKELPFFRSGISAASNIIKGSKLDEVITLFEEDSRNYTGISFDNAPANAKKILITGFDPFFLNQFLYPDRHNILQSNPSGCCALNLLNQTTVNGKGYVQSMIVPVRYADFDGIQDPAIGQGLGIIEQYIQPWLSQVDMVITISQSRPGDYYIDKYATVRRGGSTEDNANFHRTPLSRAISSDDNAPEWIETTLPNSFIQPPVQFNWSYMNSSGVTIPNTDGNTPPVIGQVLNEGSGSNYLSNEIFYRVARLREIDNPELPTGHFHISKLQNGQEDFDAAATGELLNIVRSGINNGVANL